MKVTIEVECTPDEARRMMGLPDFAPLHERYLARLQEGLDGATFTPDAVGHLLKSWSPAADAGFDFWRALAGAAAAGGKSQG